MKKNLLALAALGASVALLAGCATSTPQVPEETGAVVEDTTVVDAPVVQETTGTTVDTTGTTTSTTPETPDTTTAE